MISDLSLTISFFDLGLVVGSNHIYPSHVTAVILPISKVLYIYTFTLA